MTYNAILQEVRSNNAKLKSCKKHKFLRTEMLQRDMHCIHCCGRLGFTQALSYRDGYVAAGGDASDVYVDYTEKQSG